MDRCTLTTVARAARVSVATVSYALRHHPKIPASTAQRIRRIASRLGYKPHPSVATLMAHIRTARMPSQPERLAFVWIEGNATASNLAFNQQIVAGARARAKVVGYELEEFRLSEPGMTPQRMSQILKSRGIAGIVFSGCDRRTGVAIEMDWDAHATAIIGNAVWNPELHRAAHYHFMGFRRIMLELEARGYRRPAALLEALVNERACRAWEAAFFAFHPNPAGARNSVLRFHELEPAVVRRWLERTQPDVMIVSKPWFVRPVRGWLREMGISADFAVVDLTGSASELAGIDPDYAMIAGNAVDLVLGQIYRNERGVPEKPKKVLFEGQWIEGDSLRPRTAAVAEQGLE